MTYVFFARNFIIHRTFWQYFLLVAQEEDYLQDSVHGAVSEMP